MRYFALLALALASCTTSRPAELSTLPAENVESSVQKLDSLPPTLVELVTQPPAAAPRRLFGLLPPAQPRKFKNKGTIIYQVGENLTAASATKPGTMATGAGATAVEATKARAPVQLGEGNQATDNTKAGQRGGAAATAPDAQATATTEKESWVGAVLPWVAAAGGAWALLPFLPLPGAGWLLVLLLRRGKSREPETG